jgi:hypothetical protein
MLLNDDDSPARRISLLPVQLALIETRPSPSWRLYRGWIPRQKNRRAARIGNGTRRGQALLKRLHAQEPTNNKKRP